MITSVVTIVSMAIVVEFITGIIKGLIPDKILNWLRPPLIAAIIGMVIAVAFSVDIFVLLGYEAQYQIMALILTGLILSAGSSAVHELLAKLRESRESQTPKEDK